MRRIGEELRAAKTKLGRLVTLEVGKVDPEGLGEVQEMIDICDFAVGLSRQLYGLTIQSERREHKLIEQWHPAGVVGVISAFNFPVAVWSWNAALALVCGDSVMWKPSQKTPLTALATAAIVRRAMEKFGPEAPDGLVELIICGREIGEGLIDDPRVPVVSATGSTRMGRIVGERLGAPLCPRHPRTGRQQRLDRDPLGRPRSRLARHCVRRDGDGGAALHHAAPRSSSTRASTTR